jgi:hypothetical protein
MSSPHERRALAERWYGLRLAAGNALFGGALIAIVLGAWLAVDSKMLTLGIVGGIVLFALADFVAPPKNNI